jgi:hypothetical protein
VEVDSVVEQISSFGIAAAVAFQSVFRLEMHQNNIFFIFLKFIFDINTSKQSKNTKKNNFKQNKNHILGKQRFGRNAKHPLVDGMGGPP